MKTSLLLALAITFNLSLFAQTEISGEIYESTTWNTEGSPYIVSETVVIFDHVELVIEPGVEVKFNLGANMELRGKLTAIGTASNPILFTSNLLSPARHNWNGIKVIGNTDPVYSGGQVTMKYVRGEYAKTFIDMDIAYNGPYIFEYCTFYDNSKVNEDGGAPLTSFDHCDFKNNGQGLDWCQFDSKVTSSNFLNNGLGLEGIALVDGCYFSGNTIAMSPYGETKNCIAKNNEVAVKCSFNAVNNKFTGNSIFNNVVGVEIQSFFSESVDFTGNTICHNSFYDVKYLWMNNGDLSDNCWCSEDPEEIKGNIYDGYDDIAYGLVTFDPFNSGCELASIGTNSFETQVSVYPNPFNDQLIFSADSNEPISLEIMDLTGKKIFNAEFQNQLKIEELNVQSGIYLYRLVNSTGEEKIGKIIKQ